MGNQETEYRVLARKYRPTRFDELIGQDVLVQTLTNAIQTNRLAHAFIMTGVRGIGKTSTARLIARALNCTGKAEGDASIEPCGACDHCKSIVEDRHVDVIEMDAASRTGVDDIRELIEGVRYKPVSAKYKVYIVDEVHMLSKNAFNALLKTLEEPPERVKFIFATTEIRKVPITVLSRCQRFDLRRVETPLLANHFLKIAEKEKVSLTEGAAQMIARAADGSVRDGLSLLDQAIVLADNKITEDIVQDMLGLADRVKIFDLLDGLLSGHADTALTLLQDLYRSGADPLVVLQDLMELVHWLTRVKISPKASDDPSIPEAERVRGKDMAEKLNVPALTRVWQILLKGVQEVQYASFPLAAAEMVLIRILYAAPLPTPAEIIDQHMKNPTGFSVPSPGAPMAKAVSGGSAQLAPQTVTEPVMLANPESFEEVVALFQAHKEGMLHAQLVNNVRLVKFAVGTLVLQLDQYAAPNLTRKVQQFLSEWTGQQWQVDVSDAQGDATLIEQKQMLVKEEKKQAAEDPVAKAILLSFPGAKIDRVEDKDLPIDDDVEFI